MTVHLRPLDSRDAPFMYEWMTDPEITRFFRFDASTISVEGCKAFIEKARSAPNTLHFAIADENDEYLGTISLKDIDREKKQAEYAISTREKAHGSGAALQATRLILQYAFEALAWERVYLNVLGENGRANAFYRKAGFRFIREEPKALELRGTKKDLNWYDITKEAFMEITNGSEQ